LAAHLQGQEKEARAALQEALRLNPKLGAASVLLGEIAYRAGDLDTAIRTYESAFALSPEQAGPQVKVRLETWRKEAALHAGFQRSLTPHFTVLFEGPAEQRLAAHAVDVLEAAYWRICTELIAYPSDIITVILYTDEQFRDITRSPDWAAGLYDGKIRVPMRGALDDPRRLEQVLTHEFTHALVQSVASRGVPSWLNEGLAVFFEPSDLRWAQAAVQKAPTLIPLTQLHGEFHRLPAERVPLAYAESALAVQAIMKRGGAYSLTLLLQDLGAGHAFADAFERRMSLSYTDFQAAWHAPAP
jgi:tetratricopeptide (TPR) repeat protein